MNAHIGIGFGIGNSGGQLEDGAENLIRIDYSCPCPSANVQYTMALALTLALALVLARAAREIEHRDAADQRSAGEVVFHVLMTALEFISQLNPLGGAEERGHRRVDGRWTTTHLDRSQRTRHRTHALCIRLYYPHTLSLSLFSYDWRTCDQLESSSDVSRAPSSPSSSKIKKIHFPLLHLSTRTSPTNERTSSNPVDLADDARAKARSVRCRSWL